MSFYIISDNARRTFTMTVAERATFRANALEIRMYYVPEGETILVTRGQEALIMEGGSDPPPPTVPPRVLVQNSLALGVRTPESREIQERMIRPDRLWGWWSIAQ